MMCPVCSWCVQSVLGVSSVFLVCPVCPNLVRCLQGVLGVSTAF